MIKLYFALAASLVFALASCGASDTTEASQTTQIVDLNGSYVATALTQDAAERTIVENTRIDLTLEGSSISFSTGCNSAGGTYDIVDSKLATSGLSQTQMGCEQALTEQENFVVDVISGAPTVDHQNDTLVLTSDKGEITFAQQTNEVLPLTETKWIAASFLEGDTASNLPIEEPGHVTFIKGQTEVSLKGFDGCLLAEGTVTISDGKTGGPKETSADGEITFDTITSKPPSEDHVSCAYEQRNYSGTFTKLFDAEKVSYTIEADTLTLRAEDGFGLTFTAEQ